MVSGGDKNPFFHIPDTSTSHIDIDTFFHHKGIPHPYSLAPLLRGFLFTISASISATHRWMPVWNQKTVSAQRLSPPLHLRELSRLFRRRHAVRLYGSHLRPVRSARECCRGILPVSASPLPCRRVLSRSQRLAACRARYLWGTSTGEGLWYSGPWPVFPAFPGVREVILFTYVNLVKKKMFTIVNEKNIKKPPFDGR